MTELVPSPYDLDAVNFLSHPSLFTDQPDMMSRRAQEVESRYRGLVESQNDVIVRIDPQGSFTFVNDAYCRKVGKTREELLGQKFAPQVHQEDVEKVFSMMSTLRDVPYRGTSLHRSWTLQGWRHFQWEACAIRDEVGAIIEFQGVGRDITEHLEAQENLRKSSEELKCRNDELEQFAYIASHDLKEPLRMISAFLELYVRQYGDQIPEEGREYLENARNGATRMNELIRDLLSYANVSNAQMPMGTVAIDEVVSVALANLQLKILETNTVITNRAKVLVKGNGNQLTQLFQNLIENSIKYRRDTAAIEIESRVEGDWVIISVKDNGIGFDERFKARVFQIFQRLHERSKYGGGSGIGLTIAKRIVDRHDGEIWVESQEGVGSTFFFKLKLAPSLTTDS